MARETQAADFDFNEWAALAKADPELFEQRRRRVLEATIRKAKPENRRRLRGLQFRVDMERIRARAPMVACVRISEMMWESFAGEKGLRPAVNGLLRYLSGQELPRASRSVVTSARVLNYSGNNTCNGRRQHCKPPG